MHMSHIGVTREHSSDIVERREFLRQIAAKAYADAIVGRIKSFDLNCYDGSSFCFIERICRHRAFSTEAIR
jgi:hypothetical protein